MNISKVLSFFLILIILIISACATSRFAERNEEIKGKGIVYLKTLSTAEDFGIKISIWSRIWSFFTGSQNEPIFSFPIDIAVYKKEVFAVADPGINSVYIFNLSNNKYLKLDKACGEELISPVSVEFIDSENLVITDSKTGMVCIENFKNETYAKSAEKLAHPVGIGVSGDSIYVVDAHQNAIYKFSKRGEVLLTIKPVEKEEKFNFPTYMTIFNDKIYVMDTLAYSVRILDLSGRVIKKFGEPGDAPGYFGKPKGIALDINGNVHIVDSLFDVVQVFDEAGNFLTYYGGSGEAQGNLLHPSGIRIVGREIFVANSLNARIEVFGYGEE